MPRCRCGRPLHWCQGWLRINGVNPVRLFHCPKCLKPSQECTCPKLPSLNEQLDELTRLVKLDEQWKKAHKTTK
jgi:DTW domain-containing protein YfiP